MGALEFRASGWQDESGRNEQSESLSYGSIEAWMYGDVAGIREAEPGFRKAVINRIRMQD